MRKKLIILLIILFSNCLFAKNGIIYFQNKFSTLYNIETLREEGIKYINQLRESAGLNKLQENHELDSAAQNHADYLIKNDIMSHYESEGNLFFTGTTPSNRAFYAGYNSSYILENISSGNSNIKDSINSLFSAIYHRIGFLDFKINEIGIGYSSSDATNYKSFYVYDMGNSFYSNLCKSEDSYTGYGAYYYNICKDSYKKISKELYDNVSNYFYLNSPKYIIWPYNGAKEVSPVFFEEIPDPLPECNVSGYPITIQFNENKIDKNTFKLLSFSLFDSNGNIIQNVKLLNHLNDPNGHLRNYEYALMPLKRLNWNDHYTLEVIYLENNEEKTIKWEFFTKSLDYPYFVIKENNEKISIKPDKTYYIYFEPVNCTDRFYKMEYQTDASNINISFYDSNTLKLNVSGYIGNKVIINTDNNRTLEVEVSNNESSNLKSSNINCGYIDNGNLYLPCVNVNNTFYKITFTYSGGLLFNLTDYSKITNKNSENCGNYNFNSNELIYNCITVNNENFWAKFKYSGYGLDFKIIDYGK